ncbi:GAF domain-containing protein [Nocardia jiangxiensis]|uniref:GAF domain-containing protein n=1 Tax=Nocardia jiangxiensis TaxID=282685 RepID=UPI00030EF0E4|nr:GAF domain-containing protein [Nocardia jiangxiensis]
MGSFGVPRTNPWLTVEMLAPEGMSAASVGGQPREFAGWQRVVQRLLAKMPSAYGLSTRTACEALTTASRDAVDVDLRVVTDAGPHRMLARPVLGPAGDVHAVRLWIGPADARAPLPPSAVGGIWDMASQTIRLPAGVTELAGMSPEDYAPTMSIAELFHRWTGFDRHAEVLDLLYDPNPGASLQFEVTVGISARWLISMRARDDLRTQGAWLLIEDTGPVDPGAQVTTLERVALREAHRRAGTHLGVLQVEHASISHWLTDPAPWVRWDNLASPVEVFHPDDRAQLAEVAERLRSGMAATVSLRVLNHCGGYTPALLSLYPYPGYSARHLAIAEFVRAALPEESVSVKTARMVVERTRCRTAMAEEPVPARGRLSWREP